MAMGPPPSMHANNVTLVAADRPLVSALCSESVLIDCNYTRPGARSDAHGRYEADLCDSHTWMLAMGPVANVHSNESVL